MTIPSTFSATNYYYSIVYSSNTKGLSFGLISPIKQRFADPPVISFTSTGTTTASLTITASPGATSYSAALYSNATNSTIGGTLVTTTPITNIATPTTFSSLVVGTYYYIQCSSSNSTGLSPTYTTSTSIARFSSSITNSGDQDAFIAKYNSNGTFAWLARIGGTSTDAANAVAVDSSSNVVVSGSYSSTTLTAYNAGASAFGTTLANSGTTTNDAFVAKYDSTGSVAWLARIAGTSDDVANAVAFDSSGNVIVVGNYSSTTLTAYNANGSAFATTLANSGTSSNDVFIAKYTSTGSVAWLARIASTGDDLAFAVAVDSSSNVIVAGNYNNFRPLVAYNANGVSGGTFNADATGPSFIAKYNSSGTFAWLARIAGSGYVNPNAVAFDSSGNVIVAGHHGTITLTAYNANGSAFGTTLGRIGRQDVFVAKYDSSGNVVWLAKINGGGTDYGTGVAVDSSGNVVVAGIYSSNPLTVYNANGTAFGNLTRPTGYESFIAKYNSSGTVVWAAKITASFANAVAVDSSGNVIVSGYYNSTLTAYNANGSAFATTLANSGVQDAFVAKYNSTGSVVWLAKIGGTSTDTASGVAVDSTGNVIVSGYYSSTTLTAYNA